MEAHRNLTPQQQFIKSLSPRARVILPSDSDYEYSKKLWNALHDNVNPAMIVKVGGVSDVVQTVKYAKAGKFVSLYMKIDI